MQKNQKRKIENGPKIKIKIASFFFQNLNLSDQKNFLNFLLFWTFQKKLY
jgi:hypothetical protein